MDSADRLSPAIATILITPENELKPKFQIKDLNELFVSHIDLIKTQVQAGNTEWALKLKSFSTQIAKHPEGKELAVSINTFVNSLNPKSSSVQLIADILKAKGQFGKIYPVRKLRQLMKLHSKSLSSELGNKQLQENLHKLVARIVKEFSTPSAMVLAASINALAAKLETEPQPTPPKKEKVKIKTVGMPASLRTAECDTGNKAVKSAIEKGLLAVNLSDFPDLTDADLAELFEKNPNVLHLWVKSDHATQIPSTAQQLGTLSSSGCSNLSKISGLKNLWYLDSSSCAKLEEVSDLPNLKMWIGELCPSLSKISSLDHLESLFINESGIKEIPTLKNLRILQSRDCSQDILIRSQPKLEDLTCDEFSVTLEWPVVVTYYNHVNYDFFAS